MTKQKIKKVVLIAGLFALAFGVFSCVKVKAGDEHNATGWIWGGSRVDFHEANLGWVSLNNTNLFSPRSYGVQIPPSEGLISGHAWSENVGWISFNQADLVGCPDSRGPGYCRAEVMNSQIHGWARILSIKAALEDTSLFPTGNSGGWQGWIRLSGPGASWNSSLGTCEGNNIYFENTNRCNYGVKIVTTPDPDTEDLDGYAWSNELGWIKMKGSSYTGRIRVTANLKICPENSTLTQGGTVYLKLYFSETASLGPDFCLNDPDEIQNFLASGSVIWNSNNPGVATVEGTNHTALVRGVSAGTATITATYNYNSLSTLASVSVTEPSPCVCIPSESQRYCEGTTYTNSCGSVCNGTKKCPKVWKEVAP